jgi:hypothetical protein
VTIALSFSLQGDSPGSVTLAVVLQLLLAVTFLIMPTLVYRYGARAQSAAEAEVARQGFPADVLARNNVNFGEGAVGLVLTVAIALAWWPWRCSTWPETRSAGSGPGSSNPPAHRWCPHHVPPGVHRPVPCGRLQELQRCDPC